MKFLLLGPVEVTAGPWPGGPRQLAVLAALLTRANETVTLPYLCEAVWDVPPKAADSNIRTYVAKIRQFLGRRGLSDRLTTRNRGYRLAVQPGELDLTAFEDAFRQGQCAAGAGKDGEAADAFAVALGLWRGEPFENTEPGPALRAERARLTEQRLLATEGLARARIALGAADTVVADLHRLVAEYPTREELAALLMLALHHSGRQADALTVFAEARHRLVSELGVEPGARLSAVHRDVLTTSPSPVPATPVRAQHQLPMDARGFTGRKAALDEVYRLVAQEPAKSVTVWVVTGMAGVGKTRLAVHAAHELVRRGRFTDLQLWADLRGFDPEAARAEPAQVLSRFLALLGVPPDRVPADPATRAALYRDRLTGRKALVLLDNAADEEQVRPLLPGSSGTLVVVTSRRALPDLDGTHVTHLEVFDTADAITLLAQVAGRERVLADRAAAARVAELCGRLPIAMTIAAQRLHTRPKWTIGDLARLLEVRTERLAALHGRTRAVRAAFDLSYRLLPPGVQRVFRLTGLHPAESFTALSVAALAGIGPAAADDALEALADEHLLEEITPGRFRPHDLIRLYAMSRATEEQSDAAIHRSLQRLLIWYLHAADAASGVVNPAGRRVPLDPAAAPAHLPSLRDREAALDWFEDERSALVTLVQTAVDRREHKIAWQLPCACLSFFYLRKHWDDWVATHRLGLVAAREVSDSDGEARMLNGLGVAHSDLGQLDDAVWCHRAAAELFRRSGDVLGEAWNLNNLGVTYDDLHSYAEAADCYRSALPLFRRAGDPHGESIALSNLGDAHRELGRPDEATANIREALLIQRRTGERAGQRFTLTSLGDLQRDTGEPQLADASYSAALAIAREVDDRRTAAKLLRRLADLRSATGRPAEVRRLLQEAYGILSALGGPEAAAVGALLQAAGMTTRPEP
ncbi:MULTISPECIES: AfsR/SARP family transcriptional regulator [Amycolatopsis]|uniref:SARP family transcriptional regulator n=1 Tax=Amycolatopsis bullii TaxID=941987 RepID=A0ABQ3KK93_9PSEU|nr:AfsR/SARP family transcriptional regulator [Amycolatopsis bullii]GHG29994.1 SARP family transcriptional regulator [Amycolatopsis bullii]